MPGPDPEAVNATFLYDCVTVCMPISLPMCQSACLLLCLCVSLYAHFYAYVSAYMRVFMPVFQPACLLSVLRIRKKPTPDPGSQTHIFQSLVTVFG
jgi:hypothetical protein